MARVIYGNSLPLFPLLVLCFPGFAVLGKGALVDLVSVWINLRLQGSFAAGIVL